MSLVNGDLDAARAAIAEQVKFDILTESQEAVSPVLTRRDSPKTSMSPLNKPELKEFSTHTMT